MHVNFNVPDLTTLKASHPIKNNMQMEWKQIWSAASEHQGQQMHNTRGADI